MLPDADEQHRHVGGVHDADERADHVADDIALRYDEAIQSAARSKRRVEVARLGNRVRADERLRSS